MTPSNELPTKAGYYWWKSNASGLWSIVEVFKHNGDNLCLRFASNAPMRLNVWAECYPGQWLPVLGPEDTQEIASQLREVIKEDKGSERENLSYAILAAELILARVEKGENHA